MCRQNVVCVDDKKVQLLTWGYGGIDLLLVEAPGFGHQPAYPVAFHRHPEFLFRNRKTNTHRILLAFCARNGVVNELQRKNRKRFPVTEKRINMLLALEPLVCFESITNGV